MLTDTAPAIGERSGMRDSLIASAQELDIESIEAIQRDQQGENAKTAGIGQNGSASSDTLAGYGQPSDTSNEEHALIGDGQNSDTSAKSESFFTDEKLDSVLSQVEASLPSSNGDWAVYVCDLKTGAEGSINDHRMQAASLIKLYIMGAVYENYDRLISQYGQDTIDANLYSMITVSDNDAANALTTYLGSGDASAGMQTVNNYCLEHGYTTSSMGRLLLHSNEFGDNYTSVSNCGAFLKMVYWDGYRKETPPKRVQTEAAAENGTEEPVSENAQTEAATENRTEEPVSENAQTEAVAENRTEEPVSENASEMAGSNTDFTPHASDMFTLLCAQTRRHNIPAQLPDGVRTASKTGELDDVENDAAILYDTANDLIIVFMSEHLGDCEAAQGTIASLSRKIYDSYQ